MYKDRIFISLVNSDFSTSGGLPPFVLNYIIGKEEIHFLFPFATNINHISNQIFLSMTCSINAFYTRGSLSQKVISFDDTRCGKG